MGQIRVTPMNLAMKSKITQWYPWEKGIQNINKNNDKVVPARKLSKMMSKGTIVFQDVDGVYMLIHKPTGQWVMKNGEYLEFVTPRKTSNSED